MADDAQPELQPDWQGQPPPTPTGPPPSWDEIKAAPEFGQLNPNEQITAFQHWRATASNHASSLPGYNDTVQQEFNEASNPEQQRLADAATAFNTQHPELPGLVQPPTEAEGFWGTAGRAFASRIGPAAAQAVGAGAGATIGAAAGAPEGGVGAIPGAIIGAGAGGLGAGLLAENAQKQIMGDEWYNRNRQQMDLNAQAHPTAHQIGTIIPFLVSALTGAPEAAAAKGLIEKVAPEATGRLAKILGGAAERFITGSTSGARAGALSEVEEKGNMTPGTVALGAGRGVATLGAVSLFPAAKTILGQAMKGVPDSVAMAVAGEMYDAAIQGRQIDFKKISDETKGSVAPFVIQNALLGFVHGMPMRAKSTEAPPAEATTTKPEIEAAVLQRQKDLEAQRAKGTITPDQQKELDDHNALLGMTQGEAAPPTTPEAGELAKELWRKEFGSEAAPPATPEAAPPVPTPAAELPQESKDLVNKVNEGLAAGEQKPAEAPVAPEAAPVRSPEERQAAETQAKTLSTEALQGELAKPDAGYHDIIQAELDKRAKATAPQTLEERVDAKAELEKTRMAERDQAIREVEDKIPPDKPFPEDIKIYDPDKELPAKRIWAEHTADPEKEFKVQDLQKELGRDLGTALYHELGGTEKVDLTRAGEYKEEIGEVAGPQLSEEEAGKAETFTRPEAPKEEATTPHEQALMDSGVTDPKGFLEKVNEKMRQAGKPELSMEDLAAMQQKAGEQGTESAAPLPREINLDSLSKDKQDAIAKLLIPVKDPEHYPYTFGLDKNPQRFVFAPHVPEDVKTNVLSTLKEQGTEAATPQGHQLDPIQKLQNTQKLAELGFYSNKENPIGEVLKNLAEFGNPLEKLVAKLLINSGVDFSKVKTIVDDYLNARGRHEGRPNEQDFRISLNPSLPHGGKGIVGTLLHEAYHHVTVWKLQDAYVPNKYEAAAIKQLQGIMDTGRKAAFQEVFGRAPAKGELDKFVGFLRAPNSEDSRKWLLSQPVDTMMKLVNSHDTYYGLSNLKEMAAEITNPNFHDFVSKLPPTPSTGAFKTLLQQFNNFITRLVAGRPVPQMDQLRNYLEAASALGVDAPRTRGVPGTELIPTMSSNEMVDKALHESGEELPKKPEEYAHIMRDAGVPFPGNSFDPQEQLAKAAQEELAKNPNAANDRLKFLQEHTDPTGKRAAATAEDFHLFRAQLAEYHKEFNVALAAKDDAGMKVAEAKAKNWMQKVYGESGIVGKSLQAVQGALHINTGDFLDLKNYYKMVFGKDFTPKEEKQVKQIVQATTEARIETLKSSIKEGQEIPKAAQGIINEAGEAAKGTKLTSAEKKAATASGVSAAKDPATGKDQGWLDFNWGLDPKAAGQKLSNYLNARGFGVEDSKYKPGQKNLTIREVGNIWQFIKANYLNGTQYVRPDELIQSIATDLNIDKRIVQEAISAPKSIRQFVDDRYRAQAQQRAIVQATRAFMENADKGKVMEYLSKAWEFPRSLAVVGHVNPSLTHAGSLLFRPTMWKQEFPSIAQAFRASFLGGREKGGPFFNLDPAAYHEHLMQDTMASENYGKLTNLGLAAKVGTLDDIGQYNNYLGKIGVAGNRGMDVLKALRMQIAEKEYQRLKGRDWFQALDEKGKDDVLRESMSRINSETGTTSPGFTKIGRLTSGEWRTFLFAPRLEGARWQMMVVDPLRAAGLWAKAGSATPSEKYFRTQVTLRSAEMMGTMLAALAGNAAVLKAVGSDDKINWKDPTRSDWLAFKVHGQTVIAPSSFLGPLRLSLSVGLAHILPWAENKKDFGSKIFNYANGKVTPTISDIEELARAKQNYTGAPIEQLDNFYSSVKDKLGIKTPTPRNPKDPISIYHWAATKLPIPISATVEGWYNAMKEQGISPELSQTIIGASIALVGSLFAVHQHPTTPEKEPK